MWITHRQLGLAGALSRLAGKLSVQQAFLWKQGTRPGSQYACHLGYRGRASCQGKKQALWAAQSFESDFPKHATHQGAIALPPQSCLASARTVLPLPLPARSEHAGRSAHQHVGNWDGIAVNPSRHWHLKAKSPSRASPRWASGLHPTCFSGALTFFPEFPPTLLREEKSVATRGAHRS